MEIWKSIPNYEGLYEVSNIGRIKSLERIVYCTEKSKRHQSEKILSPEITRKGYLRIGLCNHGTKRFLVHVLVAHAFMGVSTLRVNHKDLNKANNHINNLEYLTERENNHHYQKSKNNPYPIGVRPMRRKFQARINKKDKIMFLGVYNTPEEASKVYQEALLKFG